LPDWCTDEVTSDKSSDLILLGGKKWWVKRVGETNEGITAYEGGVFACVLGRRIN